MPVFSRRLRLGTRGSPLALAQSRLVREALAGIEPGLDVDLVRIETRGDRDRMTPLDQVADPGFFSAELDRALLDGDIDFTVHSLKDLDGQAVPGIVRAAIPRRADPRDVVVFRDDVIARLRAGEPLVIGSSSARRRTHVGEFLREALPRFGTPPRLSFEPLRGGVDERVARIAGKRAARGALDGVVLALAGIERLWMDPDGRRILEPLLAGALWMVLPLTECPAAPGQGALAIECRRDDGMVCELLGRLHDPETAAQVADERTAADALPATDTSLLSATAVRHALLGRLTFVRAGAPASRRVEWASPERPSRAVAWEGGTLPVQVTPLLRAAQIGIAGAGAVFAAHWRAVPAGWPRDGKPRLWVSGTTSWKRLAARGIWVEGCAEHLGFAHIAPTLGAAVLRLPPLDAWTVLTRRGAETSWRDTGVGTVLATYRTERADEVPAPADAIAASTDFFWGSIEQFRAAERWLPHGARHACGAGKTASALKHAGVAALVFPSRREWRQWLP